MSKSLLSLTAGTTSALILGYCLYYDQKRRSDPEYKRKVHDRRRLSELHKLRYYDIDSDDDDEDDEDDDDDSSMDQLDINDLIMKNSLASFFSEIKLCERLIAEGSPNEGLSHLANAILMCTQPMPMIQTLRETLPKPIFLPLMRQLEELHKMETDKSSSHSSSESNTSLVQLQEICDL